MDCKAVRRVLWRVVVLAVITAPASGAESPPMPGDAGDGIPQSAYLPTEEEFGETQTVRELRGRLGQVEAELRGLRMEAGSGGRGETHPSPWYLALGAGWHSLGLGSLRSEIERRATAGRSAYVDSLASYGVKGDALVVSRGTSGGFDSEAEVGRELSRRAGVGVRLAYSDPGSIQAGVAGQDADGSHIDGTWKAGGHLLSVIGGVWAQFWGSGDAGARGWFYAGRMSADLTVEESRDLRVVRAGLRELGIDTLDYSASAPCFEIGGAVDTPAGPGTRLFVEAAYRHAVIRRMGLAKASIGTGGSLHRAGEVLAGPDGSPVRLDLGGVAVRIGIRLGYPGGR